LLHGEIQKFGMWKNCTVVLRVSKIMIGPSHSCHVLNVHGV